ncbi:putative ribose-5-phosphate isomerase [Rosa chinensis]|uniref:ribose-5-phosphate isomerase n=1 Tax=Rosa chinensis TaxID=74649 RepID=A0A2P6Q7E8_ROSCH|nr:putative ribose-5-phosphate isomerase [Rosa chinensis]
MHKWIKLVRPFSCLLSFPISGFSSSILTQDELKKITAYKVVESGMIFHLGSGSIVKHTVDRLSELLQPGKVHNIIGISENTHQQVISLRIPLSNLDDYPILDLAIDDADEVDPHLNLVKGCCGYLLREKMVEGVC